MKNLRFRLFFFLWIVSMVFITGLVDDAHARPEFAATQNSPCFKCHVNPTGGGARNGTGFFFGQNIALESATKALDRKYPEWGQFVPVISDKLQFGADLRVMWHDIQDDPDIPDETEGPNASTFYLMQSTIPDRVSVTLNTKIDDKLFGKVVPGGTHRIVIVVVVVIIVR